MTEDKKMSLPEFNRAKSTMKVEEALKVLKKADKPISLASVAKEAEISRKTLYNRPDLKAMVEEAISLQSDLKAPVSPPTRSKRQNGTLQAERIEKLRAENKQLKEDKKSLLTENANLTTENLNFKRRIYDLEQYIQQIQSSKITQLKDKNS
ncbi:DUF6262 family protein [Lysinibacillus sp. JNUCC 51]|uniref:DUF6262 family protein n=1 Tax=Lysinibacillus sp. JNUCC-51 TaxID=2792479 RepID=UPI001935434D|nr:hypothetical protein JNUCC51_07610 [Lysinibacillus sp. JNUCC-51]